MGSISLRPSRPLPIPGKLSHTSAAGCSTHHNSSAVADSWILAQTGRVEKLGLDLEQPQVMLMLHRQNPSLIGSDEDNVDG